MRRRVGTGSRNPAEAWSGAAKVFTNVCTVFFGMVRAQRGGAEPSPPPYVYSILGRAPPLCTVSSGRASVYCLAAGRRGWCRAVPAGSACSSLVRRVLEAYNGCQNESAAHGRPHTRCTHAYILYPDSRNHRKKRPTTAPHTPREARFSQIPQIHSTRAPHTTPARAPRRIRRRSRGGPRPHSGHTCEIVASWGRPPPGPRREHSWVAGPGVRAGLPRSLVVGKLEYPLLMSLVRCRMSAWQGHEVLTLVCRLVRVVHDPGPARTRVAAGPARPRPAPPLRGATGHHMRMRALYYPLGLAATTPSYQGSRCSNHAVRHVGWTPVGAERVSGGQIGWRRARAVAHPTAATARPALREYFLSHTNGPHIRPYKFAEVISMNPPTSAVRTFVTVGVVGTLLPYPPLQLLFPLFFPCKTNIDH